MSGLAQFFQEFLQKNIIVTIVVIAVLLVRILLQKFPKKYSFVLWSFVGIRMVFDSFVSSGISLFALIGGIRDRFRAVFNADAASGMHLPGQFLAGNPVNIGGTSVDGAFSGNGMDTENGMVGGDSYPAFSVNTIFQGGGQNGVVPWQSTEIGAGIDSAVANGNSTEIILAILALLWIGGMLTILAYGMYSYVNCKRMVFQAVKLKGNVWECDRISSPFVLGILTPQIYIPFQVEEISREYILAHERCHIRRRDYLTKLLAFSLLAIYWLNPFAWLAFYLMSRDMEMSCDEAVLRQYGSDIKKVYSTSLLQFAEERVRYSFAPIAFGEADAGKRIKNVLKFRKPKVWLTGLVLLMIGLFGTACLTNEKESVNADGAEDGNTNYEEDNSNNGSMTPDLENPGTNGGGNFKEDVGEHNPGEHNPRVNNQDSINIIPDSAENATGPAEEINAALYEIYMKAVQRLVNVHIFPNEQESDGVADNYYRITDVDGDGRNELIINYPNARATAGMIYYIFDYDLETSQFQQELAVYPAVKIYDNGIVIAESSHNHGRSDLDDFWPYNLYQYNESTDTYEHITWVDAWESIRYEGDEPDKDFPVEKDKDGDGVLYYTVDDSFEPVAFMDKGEYLDWLAGLTEGASLLQIEYEKLPVEECTGEIVWENRYLDMNGNGVDDYVSVRIEKEGEECRNVVTVWLDDGTKREVEYPGKTGWKEDWIAVKNARLRYPDKDSLVIGLTDTAGNYGGTDVHVLSFVGEGESAELTEELTVLDAGRMDREYERYQDSIYELDALITYTPGEDSVKYMASLGTNAILVREYEHPQYSSGRRFYFYWQDNEWKMLEVVRKVIEYWTGEQEEVATADSYIFGAQELEIDLNGDGRNDKVTVTDWRLERETYEAYTRLIADVENTVAIKDYEEWFSSALEADGSFYRPGCRGQESGDSYHNGCFLSGRGMVYREA